MSDGSMDDLLQLYRRSSREAPTPQIDACILLAAAEQANRHSRFRQWLWPMAAAAAVLLWANLHVPRDTQSAAMQLMPGYGAGRIRAELLQMDVKPPSSDVAHYLMGIAIVSPSDNKEISP